MCEKNSTKIVHFKAGANIFPYTHLLFQLFFPLLEHYVLCIYMINRSFVKIFLGKLDLTGLVIGGYYSKKKMPPFIIIYYPPEVDN